MRTSSRQSSRSSRAVGPDLPFDPSPYLRRSARAVSIAKVGSASRSGASSTAQYAHHKLIHQVGHTSLPIIASEDLPLDHEARKVSWPLSG